MLNKQTDLNSLVLWNKGRELCILLLENIALKKFSLGTCVLIFLILLLYSTCIERNKYLKVGYWGMNYPTLCVCMCVKRH